MRENGVQAKTPEGLASIMLRSDTIRESAEGMYAGPLHHLHEGIPAEAENNEDWLDMYAKVRYNGFRIGENIVLLPRMGLLNHSCQPNVALFPADPHEACQVLLVVITQDGIRRGEEVLLCYESELLFAPVQRRRPQLMQTWNFMCKCGACESEDSEDQIDAPDVVINDDLESLTSTDPRLLKDLWLFHRRGDSMHRPLGADVRRQMFTAQLSAACAILPCLHPKLRDIFEELRGLCQPSASQEHCVKLCQFYDGLARGENVEWSA